jgi:hypothetical protein
MTDYVFTHAVYAPPESTGTVTARLMFDARTLKLSTREATDGWVTRETRFHSGDATEVALDIYAGDAFNGPVYVDDFRLEELHKPFRYDSWDTEFVDVDLAEQQADYDEDGAVNLIEYALDGNPTNPADMGVEPSLVVQGDTLQYRYRLRNDDLNLASSTEVCTDLPSAVWPAVDGETMTTGTAGPYDEIAQEVPVDMPQAFFRLKVETRSSHYINDGWYEIVPSGTADDTVLIQDALDQLQAGDTLKLKGDFFIADTIYLPSNCKWILEGSLSLADNADDDLDRVGWYEELNDANNNIIDARRRTGISEQPGGAVNIEMSGGTYYGNSASNTKSLRFLNFVSVTDSYFHDMLITDVSDDNFTLGPGCNGNLCRNLVGSFSVTGNGMTDKGDHNTWVDCVAEDCTGPDGDGWTPKCRYSEFYRCISRRNGGPGFGMYCRTDGSGNPDDIGETIDGNKFFECVAYENDGAGFSFNISGNSGAGATIRSNFVQAVCYSNEQSGVNFRNKTLDGLVTDNEIDLFCYGNQGKRATGALSSTAGGVGTDAGSAYPPMTGITGSIVSFDNIQWDVNTDKAFACAITVYHPTGENAPVLKRGDPSNVLTVLGFDCTDPLTEWCMQAYCNHISNP